MANGNLHLVGKKDWILVNPWLWLAYGFALTAWSWLWTYTFADRSSDYRVIVLAAGLLSASIAVWLRWSDRQNVYLPAAATVFVRLGLGALFALAGLGVSALFISTFLNDGIGWRTGPASLVWITVAPLSFAAAWRCLTRGQTRGQLEIDEETGLVFVLAAALCLLGSFTLNAEADDWETMRLFLRVLTSVSLQAAALMLVTIRVRRLMLSLLFTLHFVAISTACLAVPPAPWILLQTWMRLSRPYLEFMYMNNAYHFYAPEPGPTSYLWFRIIYADPRGNEEVGLWYKVPEVEEDGTMRHSVALEYQRFLSLTEAIAAHDPLPPPYVLNALGQIDTPPIFKNRLMLLPGPVIVGQETAKYPRIPLHPDIPNMQQVIVPNDYSRRLIASYARYVAHKFAVDPGHPDWPLKVVKVYRVIHAIPQIGWLYNHRSPTDPALFRPYFMGNFQADGTLLDADETRRDPYLYWLLPILRDDPNDNESAIKDYARKHAGDAEWVRPRGQKKWVAP